MSMVKIKILYVEDELFLGKIVRESLETRNFEVIMEIDGAPVMQTFLRIKPDVCVFDIMLPNKDGFTIAEEVREVDRDVPIIFLTAKTQTIDLVRGFSIGANDYIKKPFSMEELIVRIENALKYRNKINREEPIQEHLRLGKFLFHLNRQILVAGNDEKKLSFRESELLKLLYQNRDKIIDRKEILNLLWGNDSFFNSRNLDVYITKLRGYLKMDESIEILTIKGIGYRFIIS
jgi:DNA-binding response OmpR family regulator